MNKYLKNFLHRGLIFGGFGPIVVGIVFAIHSVSGTGVQISGDKICLAIISSYILAFLHAGASVFNQIEGWSVPKSLFWHFSTLFVAYSGCYIVNSWIPFEPLVLLIFAGVFILIYFVIWISVYLSVKAVSRKLNSKLH